MHRTPTRTLLLATGTLAGALLFSGCPELATCEDGSRYVQGTGCVATGDTDGGADAAIDAAPPVDSGPPCEGRCEPRLCDESDGTCDECEVGAAVSDCTTPERPVCIAGTCSPCASDADCSGLPATPECDLDTTTCVRCTPANEADVCNGTSCNPATGLCTETPVRSSPPCGACVADSECVTGHCVPMLFEGAPRGQTYCLAIQSGACPRPFSYPVMGRTSASGETGLTYCAPNELLTTCEAVRALQTSRMCGDPSECAPEGARCGVVSGASGRCTYECGVDLDCPSGQPCGLTSGSCGGP